MAKYYVDHSCGHTREHQLYGKTEGRKRKIEWLETLPCMDCKRQQDAAERQQKSREAAKANQAAGRPPLIGSDKQIAWAEVIRLRKLDALDIVCSDAAHDVIVQTRDWASQITNAKWWIDHRDPPPKFRSPAASIQALTGRYEATTSDHVSQMLVMSPHMTREAAQSLGILEQWEEHLVQEAERQAEKNKKEKKQADKEKCQSLGLTGRVNVWSRDRDDQQRVYGNGWTYYYRGRHQGKLENGTELDDDTLIGLGDHLCERWTNLKLDLD